MYLCKKILMDKKEQYTTLTKTKEIFFNASEKIKSILLNTKVKYYLLFQALYTSNLFAQEQTQAANQPVEKSINFYNIEMFCIYGLTALLCGIVLGSAAKTGIALKKLSLKDPERFLNQLRRCTSTTLAEDVIKNNPSLFADLAKIALDNLHNKDNLDVYSKLVNKIDEHKNILEHNIYIVFIALAASLLPLLGFLGTVAGMQEALKSLEFSNGQRAAQLVKGIGDALTTTKYGLWGLIPTNFAYLFLYFKQTKTYDELLNFIQEEKLHYSIKHLRTNKKD